MAVSSPGPTVAAPAVTVRLMGEVVESDIPLSGLAETPVVSAAVVIRADSGGFPARGELVREVALDGSDGAIIQIFENEDGIQYVARGVGAFWIPPAGDQIRHRVEEGARPDDVEHLLVGPLIGLALQCQGRILLHAGAVQLDGGAVAFSAGHGYGKSTLAASFVRAGHPLITDDLLPLVEEGGRVAARPSVPRIKLWRDSLEALGEDAAGHEQVVSWLEKRRITLDRQRGEVCAGDIPLTALYLLDPHLDETRPIEFMNLEPVTGALQIVSGMYMAEMLRGERARRALAAATRLVEAMPVRRVSYYRSFTALPAVREAIARDARHLTRPART